MKRLPLVSPIDRALFLRAQPYLEGLPPSVLAVLASYTEEQFYAAGATIRRADAPIDRVLFLGYGVLGIQDAPDGEAGRAIEAPGAVGLAHHFAGAHRGPAVRAVADTLCLEISTLDLDQILEDHFALLLQMARTTCEQIAATGRALGGDRLEEPGFARDDHRETPIALDLVHRLARAKRAPFLQGTNLTVLGELLRSDEPVFVEAGEALWKRGDAVDRMVLVLDGSFRSEGSDGACRAPSGAVVGAWEILGDEPRSEGWVAEGPSRIISIQRDLFTDLLEDHFEFGWAYLQKASQRLVRSWEALAAGAGDASRLREGIGDE